MGTATTATGGSAAAERFGRWIYASTSLAFAGAVALSGVVGRAPLSTVLGGTLAALGIAGAVVAAVALTRAVRRPPEQRRSSPEGSS